MNSGRTFRAHRRDLRSGLAEAARTEPASGAFERLGWQRLGNTVYRYPALGDTPVAEDWFYHVLPALMLLRAYSRFAAGSQRGLVRFTIDAYSSTGFNQESSLGTCPLAANEIEYLRPSRSGEAMSRQRLADWIDSIDWPYPEVEDEEES